MLIAPYRSTGLGRRYIAGALMCVFLALPAAGLASTLDEQDRGGPPSPDNCATLARPSASGWRDLSLDTFVTGVLGGQATELFATDGTSIFRTTDSGCSFSSILSMTDPPGGIILPPGSVVFQLWGRDTPTGPLFASVGVGTESSASRLLQWSPIDDKWTDLSVGIPPAGAILDVEYIEAAQTSFLLFGAPGGPTALFSRSGNSLTWSPSLDVSADGVLGTINAPRKSISLLALEDDPSSPTTLLAGGAEDYYYVDAKEGVWTREAAVPRGVELIDRRNGTANSPLAVITGSNLFYNTSSEWFNSPLIERAADATIDDEGTVSIVGAASGDVFRLEGNDWRSLSASVDDRFTAVSSMGGTIAGVAGGQLMSWVDLADAGSPFLGLPLQPSGCGDRNWLAELPEPADLGSASIVPGFRRLELPVGTTRTLSYELSLPESPTPADLFFNVDTTGSMSDVICGVQRQIGHIAEEVLARGVDVYFGVGDMEDTEHGGVANDPEGLCGEYVQEGESLEGEELDQSYLRLLDSSPPGPILADALAQMDTAPGEGGDGPEADLIALYQIATGSGQDVSPSGPSACDTLADQETHFRPGALKIVVNITDNQFHTKKEYEEEASAGPGYVGMGYSRREVVSALRNREILQVGLAAGYRANQDLARMALATGARAVEPIDCNSDGRIDVYRGNPLVCPIPLSGTVELAQPLVDIVESIQDLQDVDLHAIQGQSMVTRITPSVFPQVNVKEPHRGLTFDVTYRCGFGDGGTVSPVTVAATLRQKPVAITRTEVACVDVLPTVGRRIVGLGLLPPPPPPPLTPQPQPKPQAQPQPRPNTQPEPQPQAQPDAQANAVTVTQRQEQPQLAFVQAAQSLQERAGPQHAMVRSRLATKRADLPYGWLLGAGLSIAAALQISAVRLITRKEGPGRR